VRPCFSKEPTQLLNPSTLSEPRAAIIAPHIRKITNPGSFGGTPLLDAIATSTLVGLVPNPEALERQYRVIRLLNAQGISHAPKSNQYMGFVVFNRQSWQLTLDDISWRLKSPGDDEAFDCPEYPDERYLHFVESENIRDPEVKMWRDGIDSYSQDLTQATLGWYEQSISFVFELGLHRLRLGHSIFVYYLTSVILTFGIERHLAKFSVDEYRSETILWILIHQLFHTGHTIPDEYSQDVKQWIRILLAAVVKKGADIYEVLKTHQDGFIRTNILSAGQCMAKVGLFGTWLKALKLAGVDLVDYLVKERLLYQERWGTHSYSGMEILDLAWDRVEHVDIEDASCCLEQFDIYEALFGESAVLKVVDEMEDPGSMEGDSSGEDGDGGGDVDEDEDESEDGDGGVNLAEASPGPGSLIS
jgi:hypothetical protein